MQIPQLGNNGGEALVVNRDGLRREPFGPDAERHVPATDLEAHRFTHVGFPARVGARQLDARREKPMIDRAHFDQHPRGADDAFCLAEARH